MILTVTVPLTTLVTVLIGVWLYAGIVDRRTREIKDLIKDCVERYDARLRSVEDSILCKITQFRRDWKT
jgi:predicted component of type VI protein secretion system